MGSVLFVCLGSNVGDRMGSVLFVCLGSNVGDYVWAVYCLGGHVGDYVWAVYCLYAWAVVLVITYGQCTVCMPGRWCW